MVKICTLASTYDIPVIAHGHSVPANTHLTMATPELLAPMVEYLVKWNELLQFFWQEPVKPVDGMISVSDRPGLGVEIDQDRKSTRLNSSHGYISYAVFCLKKKKKKTIPR